MTNLQLSALCTCLKAHESEEMQSLKASTQQKMEQLEDRISDLEKNAKISKYFHMQDKKQIDELESFIEDLAVKSEENGMDKIADALKEKCQEFEARDTPSPDPQTPPSSHRDYSSWMQFNDSMNGV